ncbi:hypothetical protein [Pelagicoccus mobilis]|uniref:Glycoside hydrolase family 42 N-terminal domain-containing protein n=1 Tax=Pelagicoccus mobilis TaxID=415221 RepID=A0A934RWZ4_9BACT|nr:hypothetical protein [Pelagicoccus mobilis]MBK1878327.1 hypothetical protein [Pelagicoccus mobilis]
MRMGRFVSSILAGLIALSGSYGADLDTSDWFPWNPDNDHDADSVIAMNEWLEAPAGKHGRIVREGDELFYNGSPIKLWGLNLCYTGGTAPSKEIATRRAALYAKYGINSVRLHKYIDGPMWAGIQSMNSVVEMDPEKLDLFDFQVAEFKKRGIFVKLSPSFGSPRLGPAELEDVSYWEEFGEIDKRNNRLALGHGSVYSADELQEVQIATVSNLLRHVNPYTGMSYAEDPAVAVVEIVNEESALFHGTMRVLKKSPTLRKRMSEAFCEWLKSEYGSHDAVLKAWGGAGALNVFRDQGFEGEESLTQGTVVPLGNPWFYDTDQLEGSQSHIRQRLLDTMAFWHMRQNLFYDKAVEAFREAGYEGEIMASNWQAGRNISHYYNLHSDYRIGLIDRHNYTGGMSKDGVIRNTSNLSVPGLGVLSSGMQQIVDRPFMLSEWIHVNPTQWAVEGPAIIGAYGMGLQGWDVSYMFQNEDGGVFDQRLDPKNGRWKVARPSVMGVFPAVARQVLRGDVSEAEPISVRNVHLASMREGRLGFSDDVEHALYDEKSFSSEQVSHKALAVGRVVTSFTDRFEETKPFEVKKSSIDGYLHSATGELSWMSGENSTDGHIVVDTLGTQAVVGFAEGEQIELKDVTITSDTEFAAIYVSALDRSDTIENAEELLVTAIARTRNSGMKISEDMHLEEAGDAPLLVEPVTATIELKRPGYVVTALDHDGRVTDARLPVTQGQFEIDGAEYQTIYYLVRFED